MKSRTEFSADPIRPRKTLAGILTILLLAVTARVAAQPAITAQPQSRTNNVGDNALFVVTAAGSGTLTYQWQFNSGDIAGATSNTLNQLVADTNKAGVYRVLVSDDSGLTNTSNEAVLSLPYGNRTRITQWNFNTPPLSGTATSPTSIGQGTVTNVGGVTTDTTARTGSLSDPAASGNTARSLLRPAGTAANKSAGLQVNVSTVGYKNIAVTFEQQGGARASAYWRVQYTTNGTTWVDNAVVDLRTPYAQFGAGSYTFYSADLSSIPAVANNPNFAIRIVAEWESTATGSGASAYISAEPGNTYNSTGNPVAQWDMMTVMGTLDNAVTQPEILTQPASQPAYINDNVTLFVSASGGSLEYQWRFHGTNLSGAIASSLTLTNVQLSDAGNYSVALTNPAGFAISDDAVLTVGPRPPDFHWSGDGITPGGPGVWNTATSNWSYFPTGPFILVWSNGPVSTATFPSATASQTITLAEPITLNRITNVANANFGYAFTGTNLLTFTGPGAGVHRTRANSSLTSHLTFRCPVTATNFDKSGDGRVIFDVEVVDTNTTPYTINTAPNTIEKYYVRGGLISAPVSAGFGPQPAQLVPDFFTLDSGQLGIDALATYGNEQVLGTNRGIKLLGTGINDIGVQSTTATLTIDGPITGPGNLRFPNFNFFSGQVHGSRGTFILSNPNNNYGGFTRVHTGELRLGASEVLPNTTSLELVGADTVSFRGRLNLNGFTETVGNVLCSGLGAQIYDVSVVGGVTNRNLGSLTATNYDIRATYLAGEALSAVLGGNANFTKTTSGIAGLRAANTYTGHTYFIEGGFELNSVGRFGNGQGTLFLIGTNASGGPSALDISVTETRPASAMLMNPINMTANEVTIRSANSSIGPVLFAHGGTWNTAGGTLYLFHSSTNAGGSFEFALTNALNFTTPINIFNSDARLTSYNAAGSTQTFSGGISGAGSFRRAVGSGAGGLTIFTTDNSYSGGTLIEAGTLLVNNTTGSGTGSGSVTVNGGVLGGTGTISGNVIVNAGGSIAAGASVGTLTLQNGLGLSAGGTNVWELGALKDDATGTAGTDFDQLVLTGGELQLGGSSRLLLQFASGTTPNASDAFWQGTRSWTIARLQGGQNSASATFASVVNGVNSAGYFTTSVQAGNIVLTFTPSASHPAFSLQPLTGAGTPNVVLAWPGTAGYNYEVLYNTNLATTNWYVLTNIAGSDGTISILDHPPAGDSERFYRVRVQ